MTSPMLPTSVRKQLEDHWKLDPTKMFAHRVVNRAVGQFLELNLKLKRICQKVLAWTFKDFICIRSSQGIHSFKVKVLSFVCCPSSSASELKSFQVVHMLWQSGKSFTLILSLRCLGHFFKLEGTNSRLNWIGRDTLINPDRIKLFIVHSWHWNRQAVGLGSHRTCLAIRNFPSLEAVVAVVNQKVLELQKRRLQIQIVLVLSFTQTNQHQFDQKNSELAIVARQPQMMKCSKSLTLRKKRPAGSSCRTDYLAEFTAVQIHQCHLKLLQRSSSSSKQPGHLLRHRIRKSVELGSVSQKGFQFVGHPQKQMVVNHLRRD